MLCMLPRHSFCGFNVTSFPFHSAGSAGRTPFAYHSRIHGTKMITNFFHSSDSTARTPSLIIAEFHGTKVIAKVQRKAIILALLSRGINHRTRIPSTLMGCEKM
jgi:hypothetical protein